MVLYAALVILALVVPKIGFPFFIALAAFAIGLLVPSISATVRRLHDTNYSGSWYWISIIPIVGPIVLLVFLASAGTSGANDFGPVPA